VVSLSNHEPPFDGLRVNGVKPFVVSLSNHERPFDGLRVNGINPFWVVLNTVRGEPVEP